MKKKNTLNKSKKVQKEAADVSIEYVIPLGGNGWVVKHSKAKKITVITDNKREAVSIARQIAKRKNRKLIVYGRDRQIQIRESYVAAR